MLNRIDLSPQDHILDASAGTGILAEEIINLAGPFDYLLLNDPSDKMLSLAKEKISGQANVKFTTHFAEDLDKINASFSQIICLNSFHYYVDQPLVLTHFRKLLRTDGTLWILDWNRVGSFKVANKLIDWLSPEHINTRTLNELKEMLQQADFTIEDEDTWGFRWWNFMFLKCRPNLKQT